MYMYIYICLFVCLFVQPMRSSKRIKPPAPTHALDDAELVMQLYAAEDNSKRRLELQFKGESGFDSNNDEDRGLIVKCTGRE